MVLYGTKNGSSMASLEAPFEAPLFLRVYIWKKKSSNLSTVIYYYIVFYYIILNYIVLYYIYYIIIRIGFGLWDTS